VFRHIRLAPSRLGEEIDYKPQSARSDPAWQTDTNVLVVGQGACWVLRDGPLLRGTWRRF
jgi:hypothetical protein